MVQTAILTSWEVTGYLLISDKASQSLAAGKKLPGFKVGDSWRFLQNEDASIG